MIRRGDILFIMHNDNIVSKIMAWFMKSKWSHSAIALENRLGDLTYLCETSDFTVTIGYFEKYLNDKNVSMEVWSPKEMSEADRLFISRQCLSNYNTLYGYLQLLSLGIRRLLMRIGIKIPNFIRGGLVCNSLVLDGYRLAKGVFFGIDPKSIDTQEMYERIVTSNEFELVFKKDK